VWQSTECLPLRDEGVVVEVDATGRVAWPHTYPLFSFDVLLALERRHSATNKPIAACGAHRALPSPSPNWRQQLSVRCGRHTERVRPTCLSRFHLVCVCVCVCVWRCWERAWPNPLSTWL
jgi:hypothetical protein